MSAYANLRDNYLSKSITGPDYITQQTGGGFKNPTYGFSNEDAVEYSEMRGRDYRRRKMVECWNY